MNKFSEYNQAASLFANLGVLVGIIFLIIEIQQNDQMLLEEQHLREATAFMTIIEMFNEIRRFESSSPELTEIKNRALRDESPTFTDTEFSQLFDVIYMEPAVMHAAFRYWKAGHLPDEAWSSLEQGAESWMSRNDLAGQIYTIHMNNMPDDMKEHFGISSLNEQPRIERSRYVR